MNRITAAIERLTSTGAVIGGCCLVAIMLLTVANVVSRALGAGIASTMEYTSLGMVVPIALAFSYTAVHQSHITIDVLVSRLPERCRQTLAAIVSLVNAGVIGLLIWGCIYIMRARPYGTETAVVTGLSYFPLRTVFLLGLLLFAIVTLFELCLSIKKVWLR